MTGLPAGARSTKAGRQHPIGRAQQQRKPRVDQVHVRQRNRQVAAQHHTFVQHVVDDVEQGGVGRIQDEFRIAPAPACGWRVALRQASASHGLASDPWRAAAGGR